MDSVKSGVEGITARVERIRQLTGRQRSAIPPVPKSVKIELTARCDLGCFFCASHTRPRRKADMPQAFYRKIAREMREAGVEQLGLFHLGESFLCDWLPEAIRYAKKECGYPYVFLTTNGRLATADRVRECMLAGLDSLKFSLNFCGPEQFHDATGAKSDDYRKVIDNIKDARWMRDYVEITDGRRCGLYASSLLYDGKQRDRMQQAVADILPFVDEHYWLPLYGDAGFGMDAKGVRTVHGPGRATVLKKPLPCWPLFTEGHITRDGRLSACCLDHSRRFSMGDLRRVPFRAAWYSGAFRALREAHLRGDVSGTVCEHCIAHG